ncbi:MAG: bifunctional diaminohydroxyphosphoribosylaminopyrimidine deaminase/5-amino-6-(5-phosphoribosylamino)uracil reductase RibD [bacterium]
MLNDEKWMARALVLARKGEGLTRPNPPVGAVAVKAGKVVGAGWHRRAGTDHAEVLALRQAGAKARGATLYVTLEPCSTWGKTPPCVDAVVEAGIARVVVAIRDPNPAHEGRGLAMLRRKGIVVVENVLQEEAAELIEPFAKWITTGHPYVTLKLAMSFDGKIADRNGTSRWISGKASQKKVHELRRRADAIMVGAGTVRADDPQLLPRPGRGRKPFRVIVGRIPRTARVLRDEHAARTIVAAPDGGRISLSRLMKQLGKRGLLHVLCEGGGELAASLIKAGLVDEYFFFIAPKFMGGRKAVSALGGTGWLLKDAPGVRFVSGESVGPDLLVRAVNH